MKKIFFIGLIFTIFSCDKTEEFAPNVKYLYSPLWKVWEIRYVDENATDNTSLLRDIDSRYIFTDSVTYLSNNRGESFINYKTNHLSLDSISFILITPELTDYRSYLVTNMYVMNDPSSPDDNDRISRNNIFPELKGKFLFLRLQNKNKILIEGRKMTEYLLLYN